MILVKNPEGKKPLGGPKRGGMIIVTGLLINRME
jgi:hypothetical protein